MRNRRALVSMVFLAALASDALLFRHEALARTIRVYPGPGTPLQDAIDAADPDDAIAIDNGVYPESLTLDKPLLLRSLRPKKEADILIDAGCATPSAIRIVADHVFVVVAGLTVRGGNDVAVDVTDRDWIQFTGFRLEDSCGAPYGLRLRNSTRVKVNHPHVEGFATACVTFENLVEKSGVVFAHGSVEGCGTGVRVDGVDRGLLVKDLQITDNAVAGVSVSNTSWLKLRITDVVGKTDGSTPAGIVFDATTHDNSIVRNDVSGNVVDVQDLGTNNCWKSNQFITGSVVQAGCR